MHLSEFHVVLVDDEPDVLEVSRLAMRHFKVYGLLIRLHTAPWCMCCVTAGCRPRRCAWACARWTAPRC